MSRWSFLTNHARTLLYVAEHPDARLRDLAGALAVTERTAFGIVSDLTEAGYLVKERDGRRNRYRIQAHLPLDDVLPPTLTIRELLDLVNDQRTSRAPARRRATSGGSPRAARRA